MFNVVGYEDDDVTQQLCYTFFVLSIIAFLIQVLSGVTCALTGGIGAYVGGAMSYGIGY